MYCTLDWRSCNGRCRAHAVGLVLCSHRPHSTTALHRTKLDFRESAVPEAWFRRRTLLGNSVKKDPVVTYQSRTPATHHCPPRDFAHPRMHLLGYPVRLLRLLLSVPLPRLSLLRRLRSP